MIQLYNKAIKLIAQGALNPLTADLRVALYKPGFVFNETDTGLIEIDGTNLPYVGSFYDHTDGLTIPTLGRSIIGTLDSEGAPEGPPFGIYLPRIQVNTLVSDPIIAFAVLWINDLDRTAVFAEELNWTPMGNPIGFSSDLDTGCYQVG